MAKFPNGIMGAFIGKIGGIVGFKIFGINAARTYVKPANPNTAAQQANRSVWAELVILMRQVLGSVIQLYWNPFASGMSGANLWMSVNKSATGSTLDYSLLKMAEGSLEGAPITSAIYSGAGVTVSWNATPSGNGLDDDKSVAVVYDKVNKVAFITDGTEERQDGGTGVVVGTGRTASNLECYLFVHRGSGDTLEISNSSHDTATT